MHQTYVLTQGRSTAFLQEINAYRGVPSSQKLKGSHLWAKVNVQWGETIIGPVAPTILRSSFK